MDLMSPAPIPLCDPTISPAFLATITTFRIIVLTYNRPESLYRLLTSIKVDKFESNNVQPFSTSRASLKFTKLHKKS